jgi:NAD(P)-dependent dehydrogenase (short-subunit alcohol dehydrogenase family)
MDGVAVVTGAAHGIGLAVAQRLCVAGAQVVAVDLDGDELRRAPLSDAAARLVKDVAEDPVPWIEEVSRTIGQPTMLVANVGVMDGRGFLELPMSAAEHSLRSNVLGTWALARAVAIPLVEQKRQGSLMFTLSLHTHRVRMCPDYSVSKAALLMLLKEMASELGPHGIRVNAVSPGVIDTWSDRIADPEEHIEQSRALVPLRRLGEPDDVAKAVEFLLDTGRSGYITGADLVVDGGLDQFNWLHHQYGSASAEQARVQSRPADSGPEN